MSFYDLCYARRHYVSIYTILEYYTALYVAFYKFYPAGVALLYLLRVSLLSTLYHICLADLPVTDKFEFQC